VTSLPSHQVLSSQGAGNREGGIQMKEIGIDPGQMPREEAAGYPGGSEICVLRTDERGNDRDFS